MSEGTKHAMKVSAIILCASVSGIVVGICLAVMTDPVRPQTDPDVRKAARQAIAEYKQDRIVKCSARSTRNRWDARDAENQR